MLELYHRPVTDLFNFFFGKHVVQPCREIFEVMGLLVSHSTSFGFLTRAESEMAMATAGQHNVIGTHIDAVRPDTSVSCGRGNGRTAVEV